MRFPINSLQDSGTVVWTGGRNTKFMHFVDLIKQKPLVPNKLTRPHVKNSIILSSFMETDFVFFNYSWPIWADGIIFLKTSARCQSVSSFLCRQSCGSAAWQIYIPPRHLDLTKSEQNNLKRLQLQVFVELKSTCFGPCLSICVYF